ncbi:helix-turn-helix domain-containing protein [Magnetococcales bacterium HHB-1]
MEIFAKRLREERERAGLSQRDLGLCLTDDSLTAVNTIHRYEKQIRFPRDFRVVEKLAGRLDIPVPLFFTADDSLAEMLRIWGGLETPEQTQAIQYLKKTFRRPSGSNGQADAD